MVRRGLMSFMQGASVRRVEVRHSRAIRRNEGPFSDQLQGAVIRHVSRRGKFLWCVLDRPYALVVHLGMSGQFRVYPWIDQKPPLGPRGHPHLRALFEIAQKKGGQSDLHFLDQRTFGGMHVSQLVETDSGEHIPQSAAHIARDPLDPLFDVDLLVDKLRITQSEIKRVLLNQSVISGVGNIYADEALFRSGFHGSINADQLTKEDVYQLVTHVKNVMIEALDKGGTSFDALYVNVNGESGYFSRSLAVYGREGEPCEQCGSPIERMSFMNRSSFFCGNCQRGNPAVAHP